MKFGSTNIERRATPFQLGVARCVVAAVVAAVLVFVANCGKVKYPATPPDAEQIAISTTPNSQRISQLSQALSPASMAQAPHVQSVKPSLSGTELAKSADSPGDPVKDPFIKFVTNVFVMPIQEAPDPPVTISGTPLPSTEVVRVREVLEAELARYPPGSLAQISAVFVFKTLAINNTSAGGSYFSGIAFIAAGEYPPGPARDERVARALHHELSSLFYTNLNNHLFDEARFRAELPAGFIYPDELPNAPYVQEYVGADSIPSFTDFADGFLVPYARRKFEQDFNSYAEILLWRPELLLRVFSSDSRVGRKARVVRDFYIAMDKRFELMLPLDGKHEPEKRVTPSP